MSKGLKCIYSSVCKAFLAPPFPSCSFWHFCKTQFFRPNMTVDYEMHFPMKSFISRQLTLQSSDALEGHIFLGLYRAERVDVFFQNTFDEKHWRCFLIFLQHHEKWHFFQLFGSYIGDKGLFVDAYQLCYGHFSLAFSLFLAQGPYIAPMPQQ